ncbi:MHYT domain-containing protein [Actinoplanes sp. NPDC051851]|uniref:MHYT domain-containing protein n=1 Tax=Actinoplanes sp. NPDC051851 TaxID=3154753 RepID=UPI003418CB2F
MAEIHHFDHGWVTPAFSYLLSVLGSLLGLTSAVRLRAARTSGERTWWLVLAALALGATGIWSMHFVAMLGFDVVGTPIRYDVGLTVASILIAFVAVGVGLAIALLGSGAQQVRILVGGVIAGLGVAAMHYTGMAAMRLHGEIHYAGSRVALSVVIAVVAATVALWLALVVRTRLVIFGSALVMGIAVNGMHFTGMSAMSVTGESTSFGSVSGATAGTLLVPIGAAVIFCVIGMVYALAAAPSDEDRAAADFLNARIDARLAAEEAAAEKAKSAAARGTLGDGNWTFRDRGRQ